MDSVGDLGSPGSKVSESRKHIWPYLLEDIEANRGIQNLIGEPKERKLDKLLKKVWKEDATGQKAEMYGKSDRTLRRTLGTQVKRWINDYQANKYEAILTSHGIMPYAERQLRASFMSDVSDIRTTLSEGSLGSLDSSLPASVAPRKKKVRLKSPKAKSVQSCPVAGAKTPLAKPSPQKKPSTPMSSNILPVEIRIPKAVREEEEEADEEDLLVRNLEGLSIVPPTENEMSEWIPAGTVLPPRTRPIKVNSENPYDHFNFVVGPMKNYPVTGGATRDAFMIFLRDVDKRWMSKGVERVWWEAKVHPTARNVVLVKAVCVDYNLFFNTARCVHQYDRASGAVPGAQQMPTFVSAGLNNANRIVGQLMDDKVFAHYAIVFPPGTVLTNQQMDMEANDREAGFLPCISIDVVSPTITMHESYFKNDDYMIWAVLDGTGERFMNADPTPSRGRRIAAGMGY